MGQKGGRFRIPPYGDGLCKVEFLVSKRVHYSILLVVELTHERDEKKKKTGTCTTRRVSCPWALWGAYAAAPESLLRP